MGGLARTVQPGLGMEHQRWRTPDEIFVPLHAEFSFGLDAAGDRDLHKCEPYYGPGSPWRADALSPEPWESKTGTVWLNPPWGKWTAPFVARARQESRDSGLTIVVLVPVSSDTRWWHESLVDAEIRFLRGRAKLLAPGQTYVRSCLPFPLCAVVMRPTDRQRRRRVGVGDAGAWARMKPA